MKTADISNDFQWILILCPVCGSKTHDRIRANSESAIPLPD